MNTSARQCCALVIVAGFAERLCHCRVGDADTEEIAGGQPGGFGETDIERVDVGTFTAHVAAFEHEGDIAEAAAARLGAAEGVVDDPIVDRLGLVERFGTRPDDLGCLL